MVVPDMVAGSALWGALAGLFVALGIIAILLCIAVYVYVSLALMAIAKKTKTKNSWMAWIPIANFYLVTQMAGLNGLWTLILLASFAGGIGSLVIAGISVWMFWRIAEDIDMPGWTSLLLLIPVLNLVILGIYAWKK